MGSVSFGLDVLGSVCGLSVLLGGTLLGVAVGGSGVASSVATAWGGCVSGSLLLPRLSPVLISWFGVRPLPWFGSMSSGGARKEKGRGVILTRQRATSLAYFQG